MRTVTIHTREQIALSRIAGELAADVLAMITPYVQPGVSTDELDRICHDYIVHEQKAIPANVGYHGFPKTICASVNEVVCHGIPSARKLRDGDIINIDIGVIKNGWYGDTSRMYSVGTISDEAQRLIDVTYDAMWAGINTVRPGATLGDIGHAIQTVGERVGFSIVREYCGHGIGQVYHGDPQILHFGQAGAGMRLKPGMIFTIEPMLNAGKRQTQTLGDKWTVITRDHSLSAQWEHMVAVTEDGFELLTTWPEHR